MVVRRDFGCQLKSNCVEERLEEFKNHSRRLVALIFVRLLLFFNPTTREFRGKCGSADNKNKSTAAQKDKDSGGGKDSTKALADDSPSFNALLIGSREYLTPPVLLLRLPPPPSLATI